MRTTLVLCVIPALGFLLLTLAGCSDEDSSNAPPTHEDVRRQLEAEETRLLALIQRPWLRDVFVLKTPLLTAHGAIVNLLHGGISEDALRDAGQSLLENRDASVQKMSLLLEGIAPVLDRIHGLEVEMERSLDRLNIPVSEPFPLRTEFQSGWLADRHEHLKLLMTGLAETLEGKKEARYLIVGTNLTRVAHEGGMLQERLRVVASRVAAIDDRLVGLRRRITWVESVVEQARAVGRDAATIAAVEAAIDTAKGSLAAAETTWSSLRLSFVRRQEDNAAARGTLEETLDAALAALKRTTDPLAVDLGIMEAAFVPGGAK
jgi:hypothetical protein